LQGANGGAASDPNPVNKRRDLALISALIEHPTAGLILFETGCAEDLDVVRRPGMHYVEYWLSLS
jgi:hypothetical protein